MKIFFPAKRIAACLLVAWSMIAPPAQLSAVELGMTPSNVYDIWTNINNALVMTGMVLPSGKDVSGDLKSKSAQSFQGKKPGEVLRQVEQFRAKIDTLRARAGLNKTPVYKDPAGGTVTPSVVFVNSGYVLDTLLSLLLKYKPDNPISGFYTRREVSGKKPSDAYSMVELANRRLDLLANAAGG